MSIIDELAGRERICWGPSGGLEKYQVIEGTMRLRPSGQSDTSFELDISGKDLHILICEDGQNPTGRDDYALVTLANDTSECGRTCCVRLSDLIEVSSNNDQ